MVRQASSLARWFPVARGAEIEPRHIAQSQLLGREIALWRSDGGAVNAWENRCPHRGVRLSIGYNTGNELRCQYHGWRFAAGSGQCTHIPAHPTQKPASGVRVGVYAVVERYHLVWVNLDAQIGAADVATPTFEVALRGVPESGHDTTLRSVFVNASAEAVSSVLLQGYRVDTVTTAPVVAVDAYTLTANVHGAGGAPAVTFLLQPVSDQQAVIHGLLQPDALEENRIAVLRYHNTQLSRIRDAAERTSLPTRVAVEGGTLGRDEVEQRSQLKPVGVEAETGNLVRDDPGAPGRGS